MKIVMISHFKSKILHQYKSSRFIQTLCPRQMHIGDWLLIDESSQIFATSSSPPLMSRLPVGSKLQQNTADSTTDIDINHFKNFENKS